MSINKTFISGNIVRDCETKSSNGVIALASFSVAVNERRKNPNSGEYEDYANYIDCVIFGKRAASIAQYLKKGLKVSIEGKLRYSAWENKDGNKRTKLEIIVDEIEFMTSKKADTANDEPIPFY